MTRQLRRVRADNASLGRRSTLRCSSSSDCRSKQSIVATFDDTLRRNPTPRIHLPAQTRRARRVEKVAAAPSLQRRTVDDHEELLPSHAGAKERSSRSVCLRQLHRQRTLAFDQDLTANVPGRMAVVQQGVHARLSCDSQRQDENQCRIGLRCGCGQYRKGIAKGDIVLCPRRAWANYRVGEVTWCLLLRGWRRARSIDAPVTWLNMTIVEAAMSECDCETQRGPLERVGNITQPSGWN